ncbi:MAG: cytochrome c oxidase subunit 3 [Acidimicrobiales bacterium]
MSEVVAAGTRPALGPAPEARTGSHLVVGTLLVVTAGVMLFGGLLAVYFGARAAAQAAGEAWPPDDVDLPNVALAVGYLTLLMSSVTAQWSVSAIKVDDRRSMYVAIGLTLLLGLAFVNAMSFVWGRLGLAAGGSDYATTVYAVTVTHLLAVVAAELLFVVMGFRALGGQLSPKDTALVTAATAFWHFTAGVGAVIWWSLWFLEGGP